MIKYLGSKRLLVPVLGRMAEAVGARTAVDLFTGTTRVAQEFKRRGIEVTATDSASYSEVLSDCFIATDATEVDELALAAEIDRLNALPGKPGYVTETFCKESRYFQPHNGARIDAIRDAIEGDHPAGPWRSDPADRPDAGRRPGRLDDRAADGLPQAVVRALAPRPHAAAPRAHPRPGPHRPRAMPSRRSRCSTRWT